MQRLSPQPLRSIPSVVLSAEYWNNRGSFLASLYEQYGPIFRAQLARTEVVFLIGPEANRFVLSSRHQAFSHQRGWGWVFGTDDSPLNLITMDSPEHDWHRRILNPAFSARRMVGYLPLITRIIDKRLGRWGMRGEIDVYEEARVITLDAVAQVFLGLRSGWEVELCRSVYLHGARQRANEFATLLRQKIAERRAHPFDDALGLLAQAQDPQGHPLSVAQILAHVDTLLVAGPETSASLAAWALYLLIDHPAYEQRVVGEIVQSTLNRPLDMDTLRAMQQLDWALSEAERLYPPVAIAPRGLIEPVEFSGYLLPVGTLVYYSAGATHVLPSVWTAPSTFDPDRFAPPREEQRKTPYALVGFGGGSRLCIGLTFARMELLVLLVQALRRYRLVVSPGQAIAQRAGVTSRPLHGIRMRVQPR